MMDPIANKNKKSKREGKALVAGTFDPVTKGHADLIARAADMFCEVVVCIFVNPDKKTHFSLDERLALLKIACEGMENVRIDHNEGMLADYAKENGFSAIVKGYRNERDLRYELTMAQINEKNSGGIKTILLPSRPWLKDVSSCAVREKISEGKSASDLLCDKIEDEINKIEQK